MTRHVDRTKVRHHTESKTIMRREIDTEIYRWMGRWIDRRKKRVKKREAMM